MKKLSIRLFVALITFAIGVGAASVWSAGRRDKAKTVDQLKGPPCVADVVSVDQQPNVPLHITVVDTACYDRLTAAQFVVENTSSKAITRYEIRGIRTFERSIDTGLGVSTSGMTLGPHESQEGFIGTGEGSVRGVQVGRLRHLEVSVWSIVYADGTTWCSLPE